MTIPVVEFSSEGNNIRKVFGYKSTVVKWNYQILIIGVMASCWKLGFILENKMIQNLMLSKNVNNNKCTPKIIFSMKKNPERFGSNSRIFPIFLVILNQSYSAFIDRFDESLTYLHLILVKLGNCFKLWCDPETGRQSEREGHFQKTR